MQRISHPNKQATQQTQMTEGAAATARSSHNPPTNAQNSQSKPAAHQMNQGTTAKASTQGHAAPHNQIPGHPHGYLQSGNPPGYRSGWSASYTISTTDQGDYELAQLGVHREDVVKQWIECRKDSPFIKDISVYENDPSLTDAEYQMLLSAAYRECRHWDFVHFWAILIARGWVFPCQEQKWITEHIKTHLGVLRSDVMVENSILAKTKYHENGKIPKSVRMARLALEPILVVSDIVRHAVNNYLRIYSLRDEKTRRFPEWNHSGMELRQAIVHLFSIIADLHRYCHTIEAHKIFYDVAKEAYINASNWSRMLPYMDAFSLGLALNSCLFYFDMAVTRANTGAEMYVKRDNQNQEVINAISRAQHHCDIATKELDMLLRDGRHRLPEKATVELLRIFLINIQSWCSQLHTTEPHSRTGSSMKDHSRSPHKGRRAVPNPAQAQKPYPVSQPNPQKAG